MHDYEVTYILRPGLEDAEADERANAVAEIVRGQGGQVAAIEKLGKKRLAYEIGNARDGFYVAMRFSAEPPVAKELERQLKLHEDVIRELLVRLDRRAIEQMAAAVQAPEPEPAEA
jgi:small subunit ribosomal protein S6